jgi:hypothetical protein
MSYFTFIKMYSNDFAVITALLNSVPSSFEKFLTADQK